MRLHGDSQSPATWRIQIALSLKGLTACVLPHPGTEETTLSEGRPGSTRGISPVLELPDGMRLGQSLAILEWLEELWPSPPLLPPDPFSRARVRAFALAIGCDTAPQAGYLPPHLRCAGLSANQAQECIRQAVIEKLDACETMLGDAEGPFCFGAEPSLADVCLVPHLRVARRLGVYLPFPRLLAAEAASMTLPAFRQTIPEMLHAK